MMVKTEKVNSIDLVLDIYELSLKQCRSTELAKHWLK